MSPSPACDSCRKSPRKHWVDLRVVGGRRALLCCDCTDQLMAEYISSGLIGKSEGVDGLSRWKAQHSEQCQRTYTTPIISYR